MRWYTPEESEEYKQSRGKEKRFWKINKLSLDQRISCQNSTLSVASTGVTRHFQRNNIKFDLPILLTPNTVSLSSQNVIPKHLRVQPCVPLLSPFLRPHDCFRLNILFFSKIKINNSIKNNENNYFYQ